MNIESQGHLLRVALAQPDSPGNGVANIDSVAGDHGDVYHISKQDKEESKEKASGRRSEHNIYRGLWWDSHRCWQEPQAPLNSGLQTLVCI